MWWRTACSKPRSSQQHVNAPDVCHVLWPAAVEVLPTEDVMWCTTDGAHHAPSYVKSFAFTATWLSANGCCRPHKENRGARCLPLQKLKVTQLNRREHSGHLALRWNGMESCLSYNAIQATALAACGGVPVTLSGQQTESLLPPPRHVSLTWSPSLSSCCRLALLLL